MNILVLSSDYPITTRMPGSPRLFNLCRQLARNHRLTLAFFPCTQQREEQFARDPDNQEVFQNIITLPSSEQLGLAEPTWLNRQLHRLAHEPYFSMRRLKPNYFKQCRRRINQILGEHEFDLLYVDGASMLQYVAPSHPIPTAVDFCDCGSLRRLQFARQQKRLITRLAWYFEAKRTARWERKAAASVDLSIVIAPHDEEGIRSSCPEARTLIVPNGIDSDFFCPRPDTERSPGTGRLIFTGVMQYAPNTDAAIFFGSEVFPLIRNENTSAEFWIVGADPPNSVQELSTIPGIRVTGTVEDVRPYMYNSDVFVCPLRYGTGMKNKILAALAMKIPVVATPSSVLGLNVVSDVHVLLAQTPEAFAKQVSVLLRNPEHGRKLAENGRKLIEKHYSWNTHASVLEQALVALAANRRPHQI